MINFWKGIMTDYQTFKFPPQLHIIAVPYAEKRKLSDDLQNAVEKIWQNELKRNPNKLYNGQIFSMISWDQHQLMGAFVEYKLYLAQLKAPKLATDLNIHPLSISGITRFGDCILLAQRSEHVSQYPLHYELAPSGGIDPRSLVDDHIDLNKQFALELQEETGFLPEEIQDIRPFSLICDKVSKVTEICADIILGSDARQEMNHPVDEYIQFFWVQESDLPKFISQHRAEFVPLTLHMLQIKQLI